MTVLQICVLAIVCISGTAVAIVPAPLRQVLLLSVYGFALTVLFFVFQAPDVALSELVVGGVALPVIILSALRRLADQHPAGDETEAGTAADGGAEQGR
jgi:energy-converting hydrogenase B subunit D